MATAKKDKPKKEVAQFARLRLAVQPPYPPMEATSVPEIPEGREYLYEPKWDGFRCLAFRDGQRIELQSKAGQPLTRYFPEVVEALGKLQAERFVLDGEIVIELEGRLDFDALLQRIHPAASRIAKLSAETPAQFYCFDLLVDEHGKDLTGEPLRFRKEALTKFFRGPAKGGKVILQSPYSDSAQKATEWMRDLAGFGCDGVMAKLAEAPYGSGTREGMFKIKRQRTAECVIGGFRYAAKKQKGVGSLLLGLYNRAGELDHVGFCSSFTEQERLQLLQKLEPLMGGEGFSGKAPGGPSRWNAYNPRSAEWEPLQPKLVCEVQYDHLTKGRFRHGTRFLRWRPEKAPKQCTFDQLEKPASKSGRAPARKAS